MLQEKMYAESAAQYQQILEKSYGNHKSSSRISYLLFLPAKEFCRYHYLRTASAIPLIDDQVRYIKCSDQGNSIQQGDQLISTLIASILGLRMTK
jgi:hypothetical protein